MHAAELDFVANLVTRLDGHAPPAVLGVQNIADRSGETAHFADSRSENPMMSRNSPELVKIG